MRPAPAADPAGRAGGGPFERAHSGWLLTALYPLSGRIPALRPVPVPVRRAARRTLTAVAVRSWLRRCGETTLVGITGSSGKTTTKDLLGAMLAPAGPTLITRDNDNGIYGLPATLLAVRPEDRFAVVEAGIEGPGEMEWMASLFRPEVAILTGIGDDHVPRFGSRELVARDKGLLLERVPADGCVIVNADDEVAVDSTRDLTCRVKRAGHGATADVRLLESRLEWPRGLLVRLAAEGREHCMRLRLFGEHFGAAVALAFAAATELGVSPEAAIEALAGFKPRAGRLVPAAGPAGSTLLLDDFKSRIPTGLAALRTLSAIPARRRLVLLGEAQEVPHTTETYRPWAAALAGSADVVVAVGRVGEPLRALLDGSPELVTAETVGDAHSLLAGELREGDVMLVHGACRQHLLRVPMLLEGRQVGCRVRRCVLHMSCRDCPHLAAGPPERVVEAA